MEEIKEEWYNYEWPLVDPFTGEIRRMTVREQLNLRQVRNDHRQALRDWLNTGEGETPGSIVWIENYESRRRLDNRV